MPQFLAKSKKSSAVVFSIGFVILLSGILMACLGIYEVRGPGVPCACARRDSARVTKSGEKENRINGETREENKWCQRDTRT